MRKPILYLILFVTFAKCAILPSIPAHLRDCYRAAVPELTAPRRLDVYLSLLRRVELHSQLDMRLLSSALLRSLRLDGIEQSSATAVETEFILPYRASSFQFHKYKILMDIFLPSQNLIQVDEILPVGEKCLLHRMLSSAVRQWERGDESLVCPLSAQLSQSSNNMQTQSTGRVISRCPIEDGVIQTNWGTVSPGTLVAAIAASLEYQRVAVTEILNANIFKEDIAEPLMVSAKQEWFEDIETLDPVLAAQRQSDVADIGNIWVATLAGDIAEVVVNQGPRVGAVPQSMVIGSNNRWNDTLLPRDHYLFPQNLTVADWQLTDAEILAGIDGLILAHYVPKWIEQRRSLRLSQVLDMYYSNEGVSFEPTVKACNRQNLFTEIVKRDDLLTETSRFAHVLSLRQITVYIPVEEMERITNAAITAFMEYAPVIIRRNHQACQVLEGAPIIDLIVATDGSWKGYEVEQFMSWIGGSFEINMQRGSISLLHGNTGAWIAPPSYNLTTMFSHIRNFTDEWPNRLNLPTVLSRVLQHSLNSSLVEIANNASAGPSTVVLIMSPSDRPSATEMDRARELMTSLRSTYFDVYFTYVANDLSDFQNINNEYLDYSELFVQATRCRQLSSVGTLILDGDARPHSKIHVTRLVYFTASRSVQDVIVAVDTYVVKSNIPQRLIGAQCPFNNTRFHQVEYEDFVLPGRPMFYRMHPYYLKQQSLIRIQFRNAGQGQLLVCTWRGAEAARGCRALPERALHVFNMTEPCPSPDFCPPAYFTVTATSTANLCANNDCRLPNQVGYYITHGGLRCLPLRGDAASTKPYVKLLVVIITLLFIQIKTEN